MNSTKFVAWDSTDQEDIWRALAGVTSQDGLTLKIVGACQLSYSRHETHPDSAGVSISSASGSSIRRSAVACACRQRSLTCTQAQRDREAHPVRRQGIQAAPVDGHTYR